MDSNDIELFSTTDFKAKDKVVSALVRHRVSYLERWEKIPFLRRREYGGAKELSVIYVNANQYKKAKKILDEFNAAYADEKKARRKKRRAEREAEEAAIAAAEAMETPGYDDEDIAFFDDDETDEGIDEI
ncbi:MAG: hypothetical protein IJT24_08385 [Lachnospiraceae bacterium]|nr:hypothetical protein [Lachnospiraceae bacterium]